MAVLKRVKDLLREHGYSEASNPENGFRVWRRGGRYVEIEELTPELFRLDGNVIHDMERLKCECGNDYVFRWNGGHKIDVDQFFLHLQPAFRLQVYYSWYHANYSRFFPLDTSDYIILATIDAENSDSPPTSVSYVNGDDHVVLRG